MTTKKKVYKPTEISKEMFKSAQGARESTIEQLTNNVEQLKEKIYELNKGVEESRIKLDQGLKVINPYYQYETTESWEQYLREAVIESIVKRKRAIEQLQTILDKDELALKNESLRLKLIKEGVPAWQDETFNKYKED